MFFIGWIERLPTRVTDINIGPFIVTCLTDFEALLAKKVTAILLQIIVNGGGDGVHIVKKLR